jgi:peptidoglycan/xylan/chitin deacetylase (PgdA/CDA1 family)
VAFHPEGKLDVQRRVFLKASGQVAIGAVASLLSHRHLVAAQSSDPVRPQVSLTIDDPDVACTLPWRQANRLLFDALDSRRLKAAIFVCGKRVAAADGGRLIGEWDEAGHAIGSHSYSHLTFLRRTSYDDFAADFLRNEPVLSPFRNRVRLFRYPLLKEGDTAEKRDRFRALLRELDYRVGHVTIDGSDWYVNQRWIERRKTNTSTSPERYRDFLLTHLVDRAAYYRQIMRDVVGHDVPHTLLVHYHELMAISLTELLQGFERAGWEWVNADRAFMNPVYQRSPDTLPAGESLAWALAKEVGRTGLRWPGEDSVYEAPKLDALGL